MPWKLLHRSLALGLGLLVVVLALTGWVLALEPLRSHATQFAQTTANSPGPALSLPALAQQVQQTIPGVEALRRQPAGTLVVYAFDGEQAQAWRIHPASAQVLGPYQPSLLPRWVKNLHRQLLLGDAGRWLAASAAAALLVLSLSGWALLLRRMGGWRRLYGPVPGSALQRLHVQWGRWGVPLLVISSAAALVLAAATQGWLETEPTLKAAEPLSTVQGTPLPPQALSALHAYRVQDLEVLRFPSADDAAQSWEIRTQQGHGWIDRYSGKLLAWEATGPSQWLYRWARWLHTGEASWLWALVLAGASMATVLLSYTGLRLWWSARQTRKLAATPALAAHNSPAAQADTLIFVASEGGSTWGFAQALHQALVAQGLKVHSAALEHFQHHAATQRIVILAATYGAGQAPHHARHVLRQLAQQRPAAPPSIPMAILGFGDRHYPQFCGFAQALAQCFTTQGWPQLLPWEGIHQQSPQAFARWGRSLGHALGLEPTLALDYCPPLPATQPFTLVQRQDYPCADAPPAVVLHLQASPAGAALPAFQGGDLLGIVPPGQRLPRYYSLASSQADGSAQICVRLLPGGYCSTFLHGLQTGQTLQAFVRPNPGFALPPGHSPVLLIGAGTGIAPLVGLIRAHPARPMHLFAGARHPGQDLFFAHELHAWLASGQLSSLHTAFSRGSPGRYVQDLLRQDSARIATWLAQGAQVRVCGSQAMAQAVEAVLQDILARQGQSLHELKEAQRYAQDVF